MTLPKAKPKTKTRIKYLLERETFLATLSVFLLIGIFARLEHTLTILDPKELSTRDFNFTDLSYNLLGRSNDHTTIDTGIVIVNVEHNNRAGIAAIVQKINTCKPQIIGIDLTFDSSQGPRDSILQKVINQGKNIVLAYKIDSLYKPQGYFYNDSKGRGYVNFSFENQNVIREFDPFLTSDTNHYLSFAAAIVRKINPGAFDTLYSRHNGLQRINYRYGNTSFVTLDSNKVYSNKDLASLINGKIVLVGYLSSDDADCTDKHYTPMNPKIAGRGLPDMNGVIIHANIIRMLLNQDYVYKAPRWLTWLLAFVLCWLHMAFFINYFIEKHIWFHLAAKIAQLISAIFFLYLGLVLFSNFRIDIDFTDSIFAIVLAVDVLYFYEAGVLWVHRRNGFKTIFHHEVHQKK